MDITTLGILGFFLITDVSNTVDSTTLGALITLLGTLVVAYLSWRLGRIQLSQQAKSAAITDGSTRELSFRDDLLELIELQDKKILAQDEKIVKLEQFIDSQRQLSDEFRRANLSLSIENVRLKARVQELETETIQLRADLDKLRTTGGL
jgi:hypothetical protein